MTPPPVIVPEALVDDGLQFWEERSLDDPRTRFGFHPAPQGFNPRVVFGPELGVTHLQPIFQKQRPQPVVARVDAVKTAVKDRSFQRLAEPSRASTLPGLIENITRVSTF